MQLTWIKEQIHKSNYQLRHHALEQASARGINPLDIKEALLAGEIIENYPDDKRGKSCLVYGKSGSGKDLHLVCGMAYETLWVITVYEPNPLEWTDVRTRRPKP